MEQEKILTTILGTNENLRLEVALGPDAQGRRTIELRRLSWGEGIGWYCQQTLLLDAKEAEDLLQTLRWNRLQGKDRSVKEKGKVLPFPFLPASQEKLHERAPRTVQKKLSRSAAASLAIEEKRETNQSKEKSAISRA